MKKVLVVSDNSRLVKFFRREFLLQGLNKSFDVEYRYSSVNKNPDDLIELGLMPIDIKDVDTIEKVVNNYRLVISLHCKQIFPPNLVSQVTCINVHPGLNPYNRGWYPQVFSIINSKPVGATIHLIDSEIDHGRIIDQIEVNVRKVDTSLTLYDRVYESECYLLKKNLLKIMLLEFESWVPIVDGNYNGISEFKKICKLNLDSVDTLGAHLDLLRALSHGDFKNAYFIDKDTGKKIYISINLYEEPI